MDDVKEEWIVLKPEDCVYTVINDGRVVALQARNIILGMIVREREGRWMKRMNPLEILSCDELIRLSREEKFEMGSNLIGQS